MVVRIVMRMVMKVVIRVAMRDDGILVGMIDFVSLTDEQTLVIV